VVEAFEDAGVVFVEDIDDVPIGSPVMLSAHGSAPEVVATARARASVVVDAVCPLVAKVHHEVKVRAGRGYDVIYVGHAGHDEAIGTMAVAPASVHLVERPEDVDALPDTGRPVAFLSQTTLAMDEWSAVRDATLRRHPDAWLPTRGDLCFATTNRQQALRELANAVEVIIVIGSQSSSNTNALERVARESGCQRVVRIETAADLPADLAGTVGVTAGASVPEELVREVVEALAPSDGVRALRAVDEDEYFPLPRGLRQHLPAEELARDRDTGASVALERLRARSVNPVA
jgi:4-hydroxy-3-methylbut-2-enyl diphosphate reductase